MKNDKSDALHAIIYIHEDGGFSIGDRCKTLACAITSIDPLSAEKVYGRAILDRSPESATRYWKRFGGVDVDREAGAFKSDVVADHDARSVTLKAGASHSLPPLGPGDVESMSNEELLRRYALLVVGSQHVPTWIGEELAYRLAVAMES